MSIIPGWQCDGGIGYYPPPNRVMACRHDDHVINALSSVGVPSSSGSIFLSGAYCNKPRSTASWLASMPPIPSWHAPCILRARCTSPLWIPTLRDYSLSGAYCNKPRSTASCLASMPPTPSWHAMWFSCGRDVVCGRGGFCGRGVPRPCRFHPRGINLRAGLIAISPALKSTQHIFRCKRSKNAYPYFTLSKCWA